MSDLHKRKIIRTFHKFHLDSPYSEVVVDDPTEGMGDLELIEPNETGGSFWAWWSVRT